MKKLMATVMSVVMLFTMPITVGAASFADVSETDKNYEAIEILTALDLIEGYEDGAFKPQETITRAEAIAIIDRMLGLRSAVGQITTAYKDVPASHWASGYIAVGTAQGIIAGHGDGTFRPEDPVTYEQMIKMIVYAMGFGPMANQTSTYPANVLTIGSQYGVTDSVNAVTGKSALRGDVAQLIYNALDEPLMVFGGIGSNGPIYRIDEDTNILNQYLHIVKVEGIIIGNDYGENVKNKRVRIYDDKEEEVFDFYIGNSNASDYLGQNVVVYAYDEAYNNENEIVAISAKSGRNKVTTITDMDLIDSYENGRLEYYKDYDAKRTSRINVSNKAIFVYNGSTRVPANIEETLKIREGSISFLDNDCDGDADFVFIDEFEDIVVDSVTNTGRILGKDNFGSLSFDDEDEVIITLDGENITVDELQEYDVLSVYANMDETAYRVVVTRNEIVDGTVRSIDSEENRYQIGSEWYKFCPCYTGATPELSDTGVYYLNANGNIVYMSTQSSSSSRNYALVMNIAEDYDRLKDALVVRFIDKDGRIQTLDFSSKATYRKDGKKIRISEVQDEVYKTALIHSVVEIRTNSRSEVTHMEVLSPDHGVRKYTYDKYEGFFNQYPLSRNVVIFNTDGNSQVLTQDMVEIIDRSALSHDEDYVASIYLNNNGEIAVIVMNEGTATVAGDAGLFVVTKASTKLNKYDEIATAITGYFVGEYNEKTYMSTDDTKVNLITGVENGLFTMTPGDMKDLNPGSIVNFATNGEELTAINVVYDPGNADMFMYDELVKAKLSNKNSANKYVFGEVYEKVNGNLMVGAPGTDGATEMIRIPTSGAKFIGYNYDRNRIIDDVALSDIVAYHRDMPGSLVLVVLNENDRTKEVILVGNLDY